MKKYKLKFVKETRSLGKLRVHPILKKIKAYDDSLTNPLMEQYITEFNGYSGKGFVFIINDDKEGGEIIGNIEYYLAAVENDPSLQTKIDVFIIIAESESVELKNLTLIGLICTLFLLKRKNPRFRAYLINYLFELLSDKTNEETKDWYKDLEGKDINKKIANLIGYKPAIVKMYKVIIDQDKVIMDPNKKLLDKIGKGVQSLREIYNEAMAMKKKAEGKEAKKYIPTVTPEKLRFTNTEGAATITVGDKQFAIDEAATLINKSTTVYTFKSEDKKTIIKLTIQGMENKLPDDVIANSSF